MTKAEIKHVQARIGTTVDGFWGPKSTDAAKRHLREFMPPSNDFPTQSRVRTNSSIYGRHGEPDGSYQPPMKSIGLPFHLHLYGDETKTVRSVSCHEECVDSLLRVFVRLAEEFPTKEERKKAGILDYYGIYNPRSVRGGSVWSMHAYAIAIDFDALRNRNRSHWPVASKMPIEVMECFAAEGWLSAGAFWSRDAMHFQATCI